MGYPVTLDNTKQLAQDQAEAMGKKLNEQIDHNLSEQRKNHEAWKATFLQAEATRRLEERNWREFYQEVYKGEKSWFQNLMFFVLNGIQLWALTQQYNQQKEIAKRTYELANRQLKLAENMYAYYKQEFQPHETEMGKQIDNYFANPYKPQYQITSGRFALNARVQMAGKRRDIFMCTSQYCTGAVTSALKDIAIQEAQLVSNAMNSGVKYEKLRQFKLEQKWLNTRLTFIQAGRGVASQGVTGIDGAVKAFHSFGADPGAALGQLLGTIANTVGGIIPAPQAPNGGTIYANTSPVIGYRPTVKVQKNSFTY